jgi:hypothetical protein
MSPIIPSKRVVRRGDPAATLAWQIEQGLQLDVFPEFKFHATRRWAIDVAILSHMIAIEIEGGLFLKDGGRHNRGPGMRADIEKYNEIILAGFRLLRVLPEWVASGKAFGLVERAVKGTSR